MTRLVTRVFETVVPPLVLLVVAVGVWEAYIAWYNVKPYLLPTPRAVAMALVTKAPQLTHAVLFTGAAAGLGFLASLVVGTLVAFVFSQSRWIRAAGYPYAIFLQTVPIVAIAPLIIRWFGNGFQSVVVVAFILSLFPILANATAGLTSLNHDLADLFRLYNASRWQTLLKLRLPSAVPSIITGARTASGLAVVGAIVGEFFAGYGTKRYGLGFLMQVTIDQLQTDYLFATVMVSTLFGVGIFTLVNLAGGAILQRWYDLPR
jgi:NitT/TauT family transport system permease protein